MTAPLTLGLSIALGIQLIGTSWLTYKETEEFLKIQQELKQVEIDVNNGKKFNSVASLVKWILNGFVVSSVD